MPHTKFGSEVKKDDLVFMRFRVENVSPNSDYCNATLSSVEPMYPGEHHTNLTVNTKQVLAGDDLIVQGKATDHIWVMEDQPGLIGVRLDSGDSGTAYLTPAQARELGEQLLTITQTRFHYGFEN